MSHVVCTYVDAVTGVPVTVEPAASGPVLPRGVHVDFALESQWPTTTPLWYATTDDPTVPGVIRVIDAAEFETAYTDELAARATKLTQQRTAYVDAHVDAVAHARGYRDGATLASYATSTQPTWAREARAFVAWRDRVWLHIHTLDDPPLDTVVDALAELAEPDWNTDE